MEFRKTFIITEDNIEYKLDADFNCIVSSGYRLSAPEVISEIVTIHSFSAIDINSYQLLSLAEPDEHLYEKFCDIALEHYEHEECLIADDDDFIEALEDEVISKHLFLIEEDEYGNRVQI